MATILTTDSDLLDLLTVPFNATTDFTVLADYCARFAETLIETCLLYTSDAADE